MQTRTKPDRYSPNTRKNDISRHIKSPANHCTVYAQPISSGISINVTSKSARAKWISIKSMRDGLLMRRWISSFNTVALPIVDTTINTLRAWRQLNAQRRRDGEMTMRQSQFNSQIQMCVNCTCRRQWTVGGHRWRSCRSATDSRWSCCPPLTTPSSCDDPGRLGTRSGRACRRLDCWWSVLWEWV